MMSRCENFDPPGDGQEIDITAADLYATVAAAIEADLTAEELEELVEVLYAETESGSQE